MWRCKYAIINYLCCLCVPIEYSIHREGLVSYKEMINEDYIISLVFVIESWLLRIQDIHCDYVSCICPRWAIGSLQWLKVLHIRWFAYTSCHLSVSLLLVCWYGIEYSTEVLGIESVSYDGILSFQVVADQESGRVLLIEKLYRNDQTIPGDLSMSPKS